MTDTLIGTKVWLAKYALSDGISHEAVVGSYSSTGGPHLKLETHRWSYYTLGKECFLTFEEAAAAADAARVKKIASLNKQIAKLEKLAFKEPQ